MADRRPVAPARYPLLPEYLRRIGVGMVALGALLLAGYMLVLGTSGGGVSVGSRAPRTAAG